MCRGSLEKSVKVRALGILTKGQAEEEESEKEY